MTDSVEIRDLPDRITVRNETVEVISAGTMGPASLAAGAVITGADRVIVGTGPGTATDVPFKLSPFRFGAAGDGVTDDTAAIQAMIDRAGAIGGAELDITDGYTFLCNTVTDSANDYILSLNSSHLHFTGGGTLKTTEAAALFSFNTDKTAINEVTASLKTMTSAVKGATSITLATPGDASAFTAGDWVFVRTGQTLELSGNRQPDAELNKIVSANAGTGVLVLQWPLAKPYAQEKIDTGGGFTYASKVGGAGSNVPFGVVNATAEITEDVSFSGVKFHSRSGVPMIVGGNCYGVTFDQCDFDIDADLYSMGVLRNVKATKNRIRVTAAGTTGDYLFSPNTGCTDHLYAENDSSSTNVSYWHIHEGSAQIRVINNTTKNTYDAAHDINAISIRARAYDVVVTDNQFVNAGSGNIIYVEETCSGGGVIARNRVEGSPSTHITVSAPNWRVQDNKVSGDVGLFTNHSYGVTERLIARVKDSSASPVTIGFIPMPTCVLKVHVNVLEAFDAGNKRIRVGIPPNPEIYSDWTDVSTTGVKTATTGSWLMGATFGFATGQHEIVVTIDAAASTTGEAIVIVEYVLMPHPNVS